MNKGGRPPLVKGERRIATSVSLSRDEQIKFRRLGGSRWLRRMIEQESANDKKRTALETNQVRKHEGRL